MSVVSLLGVNVMNNPAKFTDKYEFEITFECLEPLQKGACLLVSRCSLAQKKNKKLPIKDN
jgi:histone chaperone ASF1